MAGPEHGRRVRRSRPAPAALYLGRPLVYLLAREDVLLDEESLGGGRPAFVVREVAVIFQALYGPAELVCGLEAPCSERGVDGVCEALPVFDFVLVSVYGAAGRAAHVVDSGQGLV